MTTEIVTTGKRKRSVASVWLSRVAEGTIVEATVNERPFSTYFDSEFHRKAAMSPFAVCGLEATDFVIRVKAQGGGQAGQAGALLLAISRALVELSEGHRPALKAVGYLTRDARRKERKKYGRKKARKKFQFCKR